LIARTHFELAKYSEAEEVFKRIRQLHPYQIEGMDLYGTCLWQLKKKVHLSSLSSTLKDIAPEFAETWLL
jgi:anaphase-promoting complex subunit 3